MSFVVSFGSDATKNGSTVNKNSMLTAPTLITSVPPGWYAVTMTGIDPGYVHWIKCNMPSTGRGGSVVTVYEPPVATPLPLPQPARFVITLWRQPARLTPIPRGPTSRARYSIPNFAQRNGLMEVASIVFASG